MKSSALIWSSVSFVVGIVLTIIAIFLYYHFSPPNYATVPWWVEVFLVLILAYDVVTLGVVASYI